MKPMPLSAGVIGWPVAHSKSPLIHRFWLARLGLDGDYSRFPVDPIHLGAAVRALPAMGLRGVNVTVPHKVAVMSHLDRTDPLATNVGAVNTVVVEDGALAGYNTDVEGFLQPLQAAMRSLPQGRHGNNATLIGTGGAARAVAAALKGWDVTIHGRDSDKTKRLAEDSALCCDDGCIGTVDDLATCFTLRRESTLASAIEWKSVGQQVIINATSLGMVGQPPLIIDLGALPEDTIVYDLVYAPLETPLLAAARRRGMRTIDGLQMLVGQAAAAFELFFGAAAPREHDVELRALLTA